MKKNIIVPLSILVLLIIAGLTYFFLIKKEEVTPDNVKFAKEYTKISEDNLFKYKTLEEVNKILTKGTGVVYLGFPECPWCQEYVKYIDEVSKSVGLDKVYYSNILDDRKNDTEEYKETVKILSDYLSNDDEGNKRVYVPSVIVVSSGKIVMFDDETAKDTKGYDSPKEYWQSENLTALKTKLTDSFEKVKSNACTDCNK
mgnify:FL=1